MHSLFMEGEAHDRVHRVCAELGLSPPLLKAFVHLGTLDDDGGLRMSDLAETGAATRRTSPPSPTACRSAASPNVAPTPPTGG